MQPVVSSWIGSAAAAPLVLVLLCWALVILHYHRTQWRSVDLFLVALLAEGVVRQILTFGISILTLLRPEVEEYCSVAVWGLTATHALEAATLASLVVDRALTLRWPYRYRFSVRRNQIRYHVSVLAVISCFVGVAAVFARPDPHPLSFDQCSLLPHQLDTKFAIFAVGLHGVLVIATVASVCVVQCRLCSRSTLLRTASDLNTLAPPSASDTSTASTNTSGRGSVLSPLHRTPGLGAKAVLSGSNGSLRGTYGWSDSRKVPAAADGVLAELRWPTVTSVLILCYLLNHLPFLGVTLVGTFFPDRLPNWPFGGLALWASLVQDSMLPAVLALVDTNFAPWVVRVYSRQSLDSQKTPPQVPPPPAPGSDVRFRLYGQDIQEVKFPLTNGSLFTSVDGGLPIIHNYRRGQDAQCVPICINRPMKYGAARLKSTHMGIGAREIRNVFASPRTPEWINATSPEPLYSDPLTKVPSDSKGYQDDEPIYATLSDTIGTLSSFEDLSRCCSVTTAANDDFEFHDGKSVAAAAAASSQADSAHSSLTSTLSDTTAEVNLSASSLLPTRRLSTRRQQAQPQQPAETANHDNTLKRKLMASLSMNDLDLLEKDDFGEGDNFVMPMKSESILNVYRMYLHNEGNRKPELKRKPSSKQSNSSSEIHLNSINECDVDSSTFSKEHIRSSVLLPRNNHHKRRHRHGRTPPPPPPRRSSHHAYKKRNSNMTPRYHKLSGGVLSMESLYSVLNQEGVSYMDNGDLCRHGKEFTNSEPDFKKVFVSDFI